MEELVKEFKELMIKLYKDSTINERQLLKKIVYKLNLSEAKKDNLWNEIARLGGTNDV